MTAKKTRAKRADPKPSPTPPDTEKEKPKPARGERNLAQAKVSAAEIGRIFDVTRMVVSREWVQAGCPQEPDGTFVVQSVVAWKLERERKRAEERIGEEKVARTELLRVRKRVEQFKLGILKRKYIAAETIEQRLIALATEVRMNLTSLPQAWAQRIRPENPPEGKAIVEEMVESIRARLEALEEDV